MNLTQESVNIYQQLDRALDNFSCPADLQFMDISNESYRTYDYPDGTSVTIVDPVLLNASPSGGHRLYDLNNTSHYVVPGFVHIHWRPREGAPNFIA